MDDRRRAARRLCGGLALGRRFAQARCSETATLLGSDPRLAKHAAQTREARGEAVFPLAWPARAPMHAAPEPLYNAPNPTQRVAFVVAGGLRTFANANAHRSLFWHGLRALGGSVEAIFVVSTDHAVAPRRPRLSASLAPRGPRENSGRDRRV